MKRKYLSVILFLFSLGIIGCGPTVTFTEPQPEDETNLNTFPEKLQGKYRSLSDSSIITVLEDKIIREKEFSIKTTKADIDSAYRIIGDSILSVEDGNKIPIFDKIETADSLFGRIVLGGIFFGISDTNILRHFKGCYFLNMKNNNTSWTVQKMNYSPEKITISKISTNDDLQQLREITETTDTAVYTFHTSKKQFKKFVANDGFSRSEDFIRIKEK